MPTLIAACCLVLVYGAVGCRTRPASTGIMIDLATSPKRCGDGREIVAVAINGHRARLNAEPDTTVASIVLRLHNIMRTRAEKVVYVAAEPTVPWGEFVELVDSLWPEVDVVSLVTPQVNAEARRSFCILPSCRDCRKFGGYGRFAQ